MYVPNAYSRNKISKHMLKHRSSLLMHVSRSFLSIIGTKSDVIGCVCDILCTPIHCFTIRVVDVLRSAAYLHSNIPPSRKLDHSKNKEDK